ncbi:MAG: class II D-tagatose-bisphosphate aldolase, non-catalytic subunit [Alphaproteobacteria bacterium]|nr:class II D-tagatose-bisphosphate aldolase, non-catalytic subunit [Alphaproteobacteria bacterium]
MIRRRLDHFRANRRCTLLGVGPVSTNTVDAAIELANDHDVPLMLIASRRQIDAEVCGKGYVNNWTTEEFARHVTAKDMKGRIIMARDHGGPWQHESEVVAKMSFRDAMRSAKLSYESDIRAGFEILHIDPSIDIHGPLNLEETLLRIFELYEYCWSVAADLKREVLFEIGTEEQSGGIGNVEELEYILVKMKHFCTSNRLPVPAFVVVQTGTRVVETRNVGSFDTPIRVVDELPAIIQVPKVVETCERHGVMLKVHNTDYLSNEALAWHPRLGIHSANVAPEFGVAETRALLDLLERHGMGDLADAFVDMAHRSGKWKKWVRPNHDLPVRHLAEICGHYVFGSDAFAALKREAERHLADRGIALDEALKDRIKTAILRYMRNFKLVWAS